MWQSLLSAYLSQILHFFFFSSDPDKWLEPEEWSHCADTTENEEYVVHTAATYFANSDFQVCTEPVKRQTPTKPMRGSYKKKEPQIKCSWSLCISHFHQHFYLQQGKHMKLNEPVWNPAPILYIRDVSFMCCPHVSHISAYSWKFPAWFVN